jgi:hypothetical protein
MDDGPSLADRDIINSKRRLVKWFPDAFLRSLRLGGGIHFDSIRTGYTITASTGSISPSAGWVRRQSIRAGSYRTPDQPPESIAPWGCGVKLRWDKCIPAQRWKLIARTTAIFSGFTDPGTIRERAA